jgi:hypothetical protein
MAKIVEATLFGLVLALGSASALADDFTATLTETEGKVLVNQGEEFVPATEGMRLKPGDRIMAQNNGEAEIKFDDECKSEVDENTIVTIPEKSPCAGGVLLVQELNPAGGAAIGAAGDSHNAGFWLGLVGAVSAWLYFESDDDIVSP